MVAKARKKVVVVGDLNGACDVLVDILRGHTPTGALAGGVAGSLLMLAGGRLIAVDVGLKSGADTPRAALILDGSRGLEWTPDKTRVLWNERGVRARR